MLNISITDLLRKDDVDFIIRLINTCADMTCMSEGEEDAMQLFTIEPNRDMPESRDIYTMRVNRIVDDLTAGITLRQSDWWIIHRMLSYIVTMHDVDDDYDLIGSQDDIDKANYIVSLIVLTADAYELTNVSAHILLADALEGHFGDSPTILFKFGEVRDYTNNLGFYTNTLGLANSVAMVLCHTRDVTDPRVTVMAEEISANIPD